MTGPVDGYGEHPGRWGQGHERQHEEWLRATGQDPMEDSQHREAMEWEDRQAEYGPLPLRLRQEQQTQMELYPSEARTVRRLPLRTETAPGFAEPDAA